MKLSETNPEVREVTQRIELIELLPLGDDLEAYLKHKFQRAGIDVSNIINADGVAAMRGRMTVDAGKRGTVSLLYPLAVNNFLTAAINMAAGLGVPVVNANIIKEV